MIGPEPMLTKTKAQRMKAGPAEGRFAIVASQYNARFVNGMLRAARTAFREAGIQDLSVVRVPGAFEIPVAVSELASQSPGFEAVLCLGVILRGETSHADLIGNGVTQALAWIQVRHKVPVIHEVLLLDTAEQAKIRCLSEEHGRGREAALTALSMSRIMRSIRL